jgi:hypothetical protein
MLGANACRLTVLYNDLYKLLLLLTFLKKDFILLSTFSPLLPPVRSVTI